MSIINITDSFSCSPVFRENGVGIKYSDISAFSIVIDKIFGLYKGGYYSVAQQWKIK